MICLQEDDMPHFGNRGRRWFKARIAVVLNQWQHPRADLVRQDPALAAAVLEWYTDHCDDYIRWHPEEDYHGPRYSNGFYRVNTDKVLVDLTEAIRQCLGQVLAAREAARFPDLESWLLAEYRGEALSRPVEEPSARHLLRDGALMRLIDSHSRALKANPRHCIGCGGEFRPERTNARRCPDCCKRARVERPDTVRRHGTG